MREAMRDHLRAYLSNAARIPPKTGNDEAKGGQPGEAEKPLFGFLMKAGVEQVQVTADDHHELLADAFVVDRVLGSIGIVHCVDFSDGHEATWAAQVRGWVEDAAHLRHLMAMRVESDRVTHGGGVGFLPTVELVFVVNMEPTGTGEAGESVDRLSVLRRVLQSIKAETELLHAITVNLVRWRPGLEGKNRDQAWKRGFSWLLTDARSWLEADLPSLGTTRSAPRAKHAVREMMATNFRVRGSRKWVLNRGSGSASMGTEPLHVLHGPNGSGKSTLAEVFEFAVTGSSTRLQRERNRDLSPLVFGGGKSPHGAEEAKIAVFFESGEPIRRQIMTGHEANSDAADLDLAGEAIRFDEAVCDKFLKATDVQRMSFWLRGYFPRYLKTRRLEEEATRKIQEAVKALGIQQEWDVILKQLESCLGEDGAGADTDWKALLQIPALELSSDAWSLLGDADQEKVVSLAAKGSAGKEALMAILDRWAALLGQSEPVRGDDFGRYLEQLGNFVIEGPAAVVPDDKDPREVYLEWLENVARADLLDGALKLRDTLMEWQPPAGDVLGQIRFTGTLEDMARARDEAVRTRDAARLWLSQHRDTQQGGTRRKDGGARVQAAPDLEPLEVAARAGTFGDLLTVGGLAAVAEALKSGAPKVEGLLRVGLERGWTRPLVERRAALLRLAGWIAQRTGAASALANRGDRARDLVNRLVDLLDAARAMQGVKKIDAEQFKQITQKLPEALQELVELMTPASWAYERMDVKVGLDVAEVGAATLTMQARGMELEDVLNTAEKNAVALAMHLLCAPKADNPYRITFLDDPFQNMDELTVTITARALSKLLRLMGSTGKYPGWEFVLLLHGADDCERVVQEVPSVFYRIPWNSPDGAAGTGAEASAGDVEHVKGVGSTRADLFDCVTFMGLAWDETRGLVDPKAEAKAKEPKAKPGA